jgi:hypothetical protein
VNRHTKMGFSRSCIIIQRRNSSKVCVEAYGLATAADATPLSKHDRCSGMPSAVAVQLWLPSVHTKHTNEYLWDPRMYVADFKFT